MSSGVVVLCLCLMVVLLPYEVAASCKDASLSCSECLSRTSQGRFRDSSCSYCTEAVEIDGEMHHCFAKPNDHCHTGFIVKASDTIATDKAKISELCANPVEMKQQVAVLENLAAAAAAEKDKQQKTGKTVKPTVVQIHIHNNEMIPRPITEDGLTDLTAFNWDSIPFYKLLIPNSDGSLDLEADATRYYEPIINMFQHYMPGFKERLKDIATVLTTELDDLDRPFDFNDLQRAVVETLQKIDKRFSNKKDRATSPARGAKQFAREQAILFTVESALHIAMIRAQASQGTLMRSIQLRADSGLDGMNLVQKAMKKAEGSDEGDRNYIIKQANMFYTYNQAVQRLEKVEKEFVSRVTNAYHSEIRAVQEEEEGASTGSPVSRYMKPFLTDPREEVDEETQSANLERDQKVTRAIVELETLLATVVQFKYFLNPHSLERGSVAVADWLKMFAALPMYRSFSPVNAVINELFESIRGELIYWSDRDDMAVFATLFIAELEPSMIPQPTKKGFWN
eukprot:GILJ01003334.1.p1 GENE.GILJ01003334.1~~GILJ01003334.1.p1  ORF type:complete len:529 (+),score=104.89 GILJ01003334.1:56-1588(+)